VQAGNKHSEFNLINVEQSKVMGLQGTGREALALLATESSGVSCGWF